MLFVFFLYTAVLLATGLLAYHRGKPTDEDYLVSSRGHGTWATALAASKASESGWVMLGLVGTAYTAGISCFWLLPGCLAGYLYNWLVLGPRLQEFSAQHGVRSIPELLEARFGDAPARLRRSIRFVSAALILLFLSLYASAQFVACGKAGEAMLGWHYQVGAIAGVLLVLAYTGLGGCRGIGWTNVLQASLMSFVLLVMPAIIVYQAVFVHPDALKALTLDQPSRYDWLNGKTGMAALSFVIGWVGIGLGYPGQVHVLRRYLAASSGKVFKYGPLIALVWSQAVFAGAIVLGLYARSVYPGLADPEQTMPIAALGLLPGALAGLVLAGIFSAICSTADSQLLEVSSALPYDLIPLFRRGRSVQEGEVARTTKRKTGGLWVVICGLLAGAVAVASSQVIFSWVLYSWGALGASFGTVLSVAFLWKRCSPAGALIGLVVGPATVVIWQAIGWSSFLYELVPAFAASILATVIGSLIFPASDKGTPIVTQPRAAVLEEAKS